VGSEGMRKEVIAMIVARQKRAEERKEKTPFMRWSVVYMVMVRHTRRVRSEDCGQRGNLCASHRFRCQPHSGFRPSNLPF
jgi:hypothetical protein